MQRLAPYRAGRANLADASKIYNGDAVAYALDYGNIVGNKKVGKSQFAPESRKQIQDLRLNR